MVALTQAAGRRCLHQLFEDQARRTPDDPALVFEDRRLSYRELDARAGRIAAWLRRRGAGPDAPIGLLMERSPELIIGMLAILKAGAAYVPIDTLFPEARIAFILADCGARLLLTQTEVRQRLSPDAPECLCVDAFDRAGKDEPEGEPPAVGPENLAYVIYTSGSTGRPKGVCVEHRQIVNYTLGIVDRMQFERGMQHAMVSTIAADLGNTVIFPSLATGGCLHVISQDRAENQALLAEYFERERIDVLKIAPSHLAALQSGRDPARVMPRKRLILGGEPSTLERIGQLRAWAPECRIYNHYGPTETTVGVLAYAVGANLPATRSGALPLGTPLPECSVHVLDADGLPAQAGEQGEICIGGAGVARGYLNRPELTAEKFVPDPFSPVAGARMYRSGDLARVLPDGNLEFCGRIDNQIKLFGHRIELEEIEQALRGHAGVRGAVVLAREDRPGTRHLVAYVTPEREAQQLWRFPAVHMLPDGSTVAHLNRNETDYIYNEIFVLQAYLRHGISISDGDCILDVGANIGLFTVFASRLARGLRILCFEPNPAAYSCLEANAGAWGGNVKCLPFGLSSEERSGEFTFFEGMSLLSGFYADAKTERAVVQAYVANQQAGGPGEAQLMDQVGELIDSRLRATKLRARLRTLSSVIADEGIERIDLLKVNVEKSELDVLLGLADADWRKIRQLVIEVDREESLAPIVALVAQHGYEYVVEQDPLLRTTAIRYVYAIRPQDGRRLLREQPGAAAPRAIPAAYEHILTPAGLRRYLHERLPRHMVPNAFVLIDGFPLLANGKVDRQALPPPESTRIAAEFVAPRTATETALAAVWRELLGAEAVGMNDDFFDLGGQSLLAIRMVVRIREEFGVDVQLRNLFEQPTVAGLAGIVDGLAWIRQSGAAAPREGKREEFAI